jgi:hypothetical protein
MRPVSIGISLGSALFESGMRYDDGKNEKPQQKLQDIDENHPTRFKLAIVDAENGDKENDYLTSSTPNQQHSYGYD